MGSIFRKTVLFFIIFSGVHSGVSAYDDLLQAFREIQAVIPHEHIAQIDETLEDIVLAEENTTEHTPTMGKKKTTWHIPTIKEDVLDPNIERYDPSSDYIPSVKKPVTPTKYSSKVKKTPQVTVSKNIISALKQKSNGFLSHFFSRNQ